MPGHHESLTPQSLHEFGIELFGQPWIIRNFQIAHLARLLAIEVIMAVTASIKTGGPMAITEPSSEPSFHQSFQRFVHGCQAHARKRLPHGSAYLFRSRMAVCGPQIEKDCLPLAGVSKPGIGKRRPKFLIRGGKCSSRPD